MKTKLTKSAIVAFHWLTMAGVVAQEYWTNRYAGNVLVIGLLFWVLLGIAFCLATLGYLFGAYTLSMINSALSLTKPVEPAWWRGTLKFAHLFVLVFAMVSGHWWCAASFAWVWAAARITNFAAKQYLKEVTVDGSKVTVSGSALN